MIRTPHSIQSSTAGSPGLSAVSETLRQPAVGFLLPGVFSASGYGQKSYFAPLLWLLHKPATLVNEQSYESFKTVFDEQYGALCNYADSFLKDVAASEDVVQDVFLKIWENRQDLIGTAGMRFYLFASVRNNSLTYLQRSKKVATVELKDDAVAADPPPQETEGPNYRLQLAQAMEQLPPKCREVFLLSRMSRQSYREIADTLDISVKTVENQIGKALKMLRAFVQEKKLFLLVLILVIRLLGELNGSFPWN